MMEGAPKPIPQNKSTEGSVAETAETIVDLIGIGGTLLQRLLGEKSGHLTKLLGNTRGLVYARLFTAFASPLAAGTADSADLMRALNTSLQTQVVRQLDLGKESYKAESGVVEQQFQTFLDQIQPHIHQIREKFSNSNDPLKERALRFAFANIFIPFDNIISEQQLTAAPYYEDRMSSLLGAPISLDDLLDKEALHAVNQEEWESKQGDFNNIQKRIPLDDLHPDGTPMQIGIPRLQQFAMSQEYSDFKKNLFSIYHSEAYQALRKITKDSEQLYFYEVLGSPEFATAEEFERAKKGVDPKVLALVNPKSLSFE